MQSEMTMRSRRERRAAAHRANAAFAAQWLNWSAGITVILSLCVLGALLAPPPLVMIAALSAVGGVALCGAIVGVLLRDVRLHARVWSAAMLAIIAVLACAVGAQVVLG